MAPDAKKTSEKTSMIERIFAILDCFTTEDPQLNLTQISNRCGLPISTTSRILSGLVAHGAVERWRNGNYSIGMHLINLAQTAQPMLSIQETASPCLDNLERATNLHVQLATLQDTGALIIDRRDGHQQLPLYYHVGDVLPLVPTAVGRVLLAFASPALKSKILDNDDFVWPSYEVERPSASDIYAELDKIEHDRITFFDLTNIPVNSVAVPIFDRGMTVVAAISIVVKTGTVPLAPKLATLIKATAMDIQRRLAGPKSKRILPPWDAGDQ
ncbi:IclR family transcriptional regulator [Bifidobacterium sp. ESL0800]|uniref:IclR family transcriptional regulator n=1 Tax=Bifidobacterium sp. ESL0800 TaxID=2983236 RepID=UPI0023F85D1F|nr:IclR family transcriptional regulator [Bifidobacterium sp. ESL0800]WEV74984.1 IclR family transcriptional regulator [Bifidobacterium sp. ESL0800]